MTSLYFFAPLLHEPKIHFFKLPIFTPLTGFIILLTQTMHFYQKGNSRKDYPYICINKRLIPIMSIGGTQEASMVDTRAESWYKAVGCTTSESSADSAYLSRRPPARIATDLSGEGSGGHFCWVQVSKSWRFLKKSLKVKQ